MFAVQGVGVDAGGCRKRWSVGGARSVGPLWEGRGEVVGRGGGTGGSGIVYWRRWGVKVGG